ncbi:hypothetical protein [Lacticaseibacillus sharpeae]|uniref:Uncharacterized protein n=1 Tax=Lacticaseibacillus sharpeae JCM 1186 = DSM 20505 TaxID=1291052 RepID=A0A0R1ZZQ2_9LACO|nr:hypothetical protein [Lacticaseibacillus sharpeae]KRM56643.1 hypothetical protein FC18_GL001775 [Lacticaseibacillus sharpeae JCM 1186 = DSM 20505]
MNNLSNSAFVAYVSLLANIATIITFFTIFKKSQPATDNSVHIDNSRTNIYATRSSTTTQKSDANTTDQDTMLQVFAVLVGLAIFIFYPLIAFVPLITSLLYLVMSLYLLYKVNHGFSIAHEGFFVTINTLRIISFIVIFWTISTPAALLSNIVDAGGRVRFTNLSTLLSGVFPLVESLWTSLARTPETFVPFILLLIILMYVVFQIIDGFKALKYLFRKRITFFLAPQTAVSFWKQFFGTIAIMALSMCYKFPEPLIHVFKLMIGFLSSWFK